MPAETVDDMDVSQAFEAAKVEQSQDQASGAGSGAADANPDDTDTGKSPADTTDKAQAQPVEGAEQILTATEYTKLQEEFKNDPEKLRKALNTAFTEKTTKLAAERKLYEGIRKDPKTFIHQFAQQHGLQIVDPAATKKVEETKAQTQEAATTALTELKTELGLGDEMNWLLPVFEKIEARAEKRARQALETELKPFKDKTQQETAAAEATHYKSIEEQFFTKFPEAKAHETAIVALMPKFPIGPDVDPLEYLESLHVLATRDIPEAERTKRTIARISKSVERSEPAGGGVQTGRVKPQRPADITAEQAYEFAKQGIDFGNED